MVRPCAMWCLLLLTGCGAAEGIDKKPAVAVAPARGDKVAADEGDLAQRGQLERKIIYRADMDIVVEDFSGVPAQVQAIIRRFDAFVADAQVSGTANVPRHAYWTIRIPAENFDEFLVASRLLGEVRSESQTAQDVSEKFYDLQARLANQQQEEQRLKELLDQHSGKLEEILAVEREISRVRGEVEQLQGQLRVIADLTAYSTVTLRFEEIRNYAPVQSATFTTRIERTWSSSLESFSEFAQSIVLAVVFVAPWICVLAIPLVAITVFLKWIRRKPVSM
ncbi:DUF4349 domain-containing protein [Symmachiella dynata]|uniref:DUF4349 domain-containing protein n=1 Tax=Symmachiella dynata TaxID=2527995 RepID=UPI0030ED97CE